jgi:pyruvate dehydrogenase E2 component (dihydrolipoamide acetyltransferase)
MANEVVMPRLGWTMEVGRVVEWLKQDGEEVEAGEVIFAVEADKGVTDVEALDSGILRIPTDSPIGVEVPVGATLAFITQPGAAAPVTISGQITSNPATAPLIVAEPVTTLSPGRRQRNGLPAISPRARRIADELGIAWTNLAGSGSSGRIRELDIRAAAAVETTPRPRATPAVRRMAEEHGVDLDQIAATALGGRVTRADIQAAVRSTNPAPIAAGQSVPLTAIRRISSERMAESARTVAPVTLTTEADATDLARIRATLKSELEGSGQPVPSFTDLISRFVALCLKEHPALNATFVGDAITVHSDINIGIAVDTERGLLVPVVRGADSKSVRAIAAESARMIEQVRTGTINTADLTGGTFTISNLGMFDIDAFTPIINLPECAILGLGRVIARPVVIDEETDAIEVRRMMALSLTFDHRVVDGAPAARFLQRVKQMIERPFGWLIV